MCKSAITKVFLDMFPEFEAAYQEHILDYDTELAHVFFGDNVNGEIIKQLDQAQLNSAVDRYFVFFEKVAKEGDLYSRQVLTTTILARIGDDLNIYKEAQKYMGEQTKKLSDEIELFIGRNHLTR
ncbi:hypothetical protein [Paenibacillus sp. FSL H8-0079]|uniref:DUF7674 family protein n=1 Tax=Paenibacillus sp. FSL H8-0079 TaxID=2921375 RepID=UPI0030EB954C